MRLEGFRLRGQGDISELVVLGQQLEVAWCKRGGGGERRRSEERREEEVSGGWDGRGLTWHSWWKTEMREALWSFHLSMYSLSSFSPTNLRRA